MTENEIQKYIDEYQLDKLIIPEKEDTQESLNDTVDPNFKTPYTPKWQDLIRLHKIILQRRITTVLEFGCGYSTNIMADALRINQQLHGEYVKAHLRRGNPFELHSVDDMPEYVELTRRQLPKVLEDRCHFYATTTRMTTFNGRICTEYEKLPNICPDFIYLDGPSQFATLGEINGIAMGHIDRPPMSCDLLKIEFFLLPGTLILVDGRTANARFLLANFQRKWQHHHDQEEDVHYFELNEAPLGKINHRQLQFQGLLSQCSD